MASAVVHFEIHTAEPHAACDFYAKLFAWSFHEAIEDTYWLAFPQGDNPETAAGRAPARGINGALIRRPGPGPEPGGPINGATLTIQIDSDIEAKQTEVVEAGAKIALPLQEMDGVGKFFYFMDLDNNVIGVMEPAQ